MPIPYALIPSASLKLASFTGEVPAGRIAIFSLAKENIPMLGSPNMSDSITGTALSLARKDYDSPLLVLDNSDSDFPGRFAYSSLPEHAVRLLAQRDFGCLHPLSHEFAQESHGSRSSLLPRSVPYSSEIEIIEFFLNNFQLLFLWLFRFSGGFRGFRSLDDLLGFLGNLLELFFALLFERGDLFRLLGQRVFFLFLGSLDCLLLCIGLGLFLWFLIFARDGLHLDLGFSPVSLFRRSPDLSRGLRHNP